MTWQASPWQSSLQAAFTTIWGSGVSPIPSLDLNFTLGSLDPRITYTGASLATLTNAAGAIAYKPHNLALYSEDLSNAAYNAFATTVSSGATSPPSGFTSADKLQEGSGIQLRGQSMVVVSGQRYTQICRAKLAERSFLVARNQDSTRWCVVDLSNGTLYNAGSGFGVTITSVGGGWYEVACSFVSGTTGNVEQQWGISANGTLSSGSYDSYTGTAGYGLYITGIQWCQGAKAGYGKTTSAAYYGPRFTYDPVTHAALGLLIEEQRTNLLKYSEQFDNAAWSGGSVTVALAAGTAPDGTTTLNKLTANSTANATHQRYQIGLTLVSGNKYTGCAWMRQAEYSVGIINIYDTTTGNCLTYFNLATGAVMTLGAGCTATCTAYPGGIYLCTVTRTVAAASGGLSVEFSNADNTSVFAAAVGSGIYAWGAQLEAGSFATSYIPTTSASVTRAADSATMTGSNFSSWFNATEWTVVADLRAPDVGSGGGADVAVFSNTLSESAAVYVAGGSLAVQWVRTGGVTQTAQAIGSFTAGSTNKVAAAFKLNSMRSCINRGAVSTDNVATMPTPTSLGIMGSGGVSINGGPPNAPIARLRYYNTALTNAQLQALTT